MSQSILFIPPFGTPFRVVNDSLPKQFAIGVAIMAVSLVVHRIATDAMNETQRRREDTALNNLIGSIALVTEAVMVLAAYIAFIDGLAFAILGRTLLLL